MQSASLPSDATLCVDVTDPNIALEPRRYFRKITDQIYDPATEMSGDLYLPAGDGGEFSARTIPAMLYIHGGGWTGGHNNLRNARRWGESLACNWNMATYEIDYRLEFEGSPTGENSRLMTQVRDSKCALRWLKGQAQYGINPDKVFVMGGSAGGHLTGMVATTADLREFDPACSTHPEQDLRVAGAIPVYGIFNFVTLEEDRIALPGYGRRLFGIENPSDEDWLDWSPVTYASSDDPPFLFLTGLADMLVPWQQSVEMGARLDELGVDNTVVLIEGAQHGYDAFFNSEQTNLSLEETDKFLGSILGEKQ